MSTVRTIRPEEGLSQPLAESIYEVANSIWPPSREKPGPSLEQTWSRWREQESAHFLIVQDAQVLAHSLIMKPSELGGYLTGSSTGIAWKTPFGIFAK
jgi:hypothetical protein